MPACPVKRARVQRPALVGSAPGRWRARARRARYRNQDGTPVASDNALFTRNTAACPNKLQPRYTTPATTTPAPTTTARATTTPAPSTTASATPAPTTTLNHKDGFVNAILNGPTAQGIENHITAATSKVNALP